MVSNNCNDMVVDARGNAYVGNLGFDFRAANPVPATAEIVLVTPDGKARVVARDMGFPNGSVVTPDGKTLIVGETYAARFTAFDIEEDGSLSNRRIWAQFDDLGFTDINRAERVRPDGCCMDAEGAIWMASPGRNVTLRVKEGGEITHTVQASQIAYACMLGGPERKTLFICTAPTHVTPEVIDIHDGRIEVLEVDVAGAGIP
jgi:sugar lactone lactonase YvrE